MRRRFAYSYAPLLQQDGGPGNGGGGSQDGNQSQQQQDGQAGQNGGQQSGEGGKQETVYTIPERDLKGRITREAKRQLEDTAKSLGYASFAEMEAASKAAKAREDADKSETERLKEERDTARRDKDAAEQRANQKLVKASVMMASAELGIVDPDAAFLLMDKREVEVDDAGEVQGVKKALEALLAAKPYLKGEAKQASAGGIPPSPRGQAAPLPSDEQLVQDERRKRRQTGIYGI